MGHRFVDARVIRDRMDGKDRRIAAEMASRSLRCDWLVDCDTAKRDPKCPPCAKKAAKK